MAVDVHPSRRPSPPRKPPATSTTSGGKNKETHSGQAGVPYGARHELKVHGDATTMAHHFHDHGTKAIHKESADRLPGKVGRPGDEKHNDEPG